MTLATWTVSSWVGRIDVPAVGDDAKSLQVAIDGSPSASPAVGHLRSETRDQLDRVWVDASSDGWDGYDAKAVSEAVYERARAFLDVLPMTAPAPDVVPEPDGEIAFEWNYGIRRILSVSVGPTGVLSYAALYGRTAKTHGTETFVDRLPRPIVDCLNRLIAAADGDA